MKISYKISAIIIAISIVLLGVGNFFFSAFFSAFLINEEGSHIKTNIDNLNSNIFEKRAKYISIASDWGNWDETYNYINSNNNEYEKLNLNLSSLSVININLMLIYDNNYKIINKIKLDLDNKKLVDFPLDLAKKIEDEIKTKSYEVSSSFIFNYKDDFYIIAVSEVTDSLLENPPNGKLVVGKLIDKNMISSFEEITNSKISLILENDLPKELNKNLMETSNPHYSNYVSVIDDKNNSVTTYIKLSNLDGKQAIALESIKNRDFYLSGINKLKIFKGMYTILILIIIIALFFLIKIYISNPILSLAKTLKNIDLSKKQFEKISKNGGYEFDIITDAINSMLEKIEIEHKNFRISENRLISAQTMAHIGNWEIILGTKEVWASDEACNIYGLENNSPHIPLELVQKSVLPEYRKELDASLKELIANNKKYDNKFKIKNNKTGEERFVHSQAILLSDENNNPIKIVGTIQDITDYKKAQDQIEYISYHNSLTGLQNRRKFEIDLEAINKSGVYPVSILMGDVNGLKLVNDAFGHSNGDNILKRIAIILKQECGEDACIARHGGDEFAVILPGINYEEAILIVDRIKKRCDEETTNEIMLNISFGIGTKMNKEDDLQKCYHLSEERMYASKLLEAKSTRSAIITNLRTVMEEKTGETRKHCERIALLSKKVGEYLGMQSFEIEYLKLLALLHDIGKTGISDSIILKPGHLTDDEMKIMKKHCEIGFRIANTIPELVPIADGILSHHERWDGTGYPHNLKGEEIPLMARIVSIIDSYDAMTNDRPYRKGLSEDDAIAELIRCSGTQFDPYILDIFINKILKDNISIDI